MMNPFEDESTEYLALANAEEQYSLWPQYLDIPHGWRRVAGPGPRKEILAYIEEHWTDLRPLSLRAAAGEPSAR